jgi:serine/threonine protein kinase/formylglycine-generating enzyme required for sulfatase activity
MAVSLEQFSRQLAESGVLSEPDLRAFVDKLPAVEKPADGEQLAKRLVKEKKISAYQAQVVYSGKGKTLTMGSYFVLDKLGQGGMGMVLKAEHRMMKRLVAIKVLSPAVTKTKELAQRFQREVEAAARLTHPNIVGAFDAGETNGSPFLVMEYVPGDDLSSIVKKKGPLSVDQAIDCIAQAAKGLEFAHSQGVIHRDIKPANLLMDTKGVVKILDMGLARIEATDVATQADLTGTGAVMGTVDYMAPEQALSTKHADARSDLYSLGISLWYLLTGKAAYEGDSLMARLLAHREQPIPSLRAVRGDVPESLDQLFEKLVAKKQADRYQTATELLVDLQSCRTGASIKAVTVAEVATGPDEFQNFLHHLDSPTEGPRGGRSNPLITGTKTVARSQATVTSTDETMPPTPASETQRFRRPKGRKVKSPPWFQDRRLQIASGAAAVLVLLAAVFLFQTPNGTLRVEILDPEVEMTVKGTDLKFHGADLDPVSLKVGEKKLLVTRGDLTFPTESFEIKKGKETRVKVELIGDNLVVNSGSKVIAEQPIRQKALTTSTTKEISRPGNSPPTTAVSAISSSGAPAESKFALQFDGTGLVEVDDFPMLPSVVCTLELWVTPEAFPTSFYPLVCVMDDQRALILNAEKKYRFYTFHNEAIMSDEAKLRQRVHLAGVNDGNERRIYLNGKLVGKKDEPGMLHPTPKDSKRLEIGSTFSGTIDGVRISSSARYGRDFVPVSDWKADETTEVLYQFNEGQGDVLKDLSRHGRTGRIKGARWIRLEGRQQVNSDLQQGTQGPKPAIAPFDAVQAKKHQEAWAAYLNVPVEFTNTVGMKFRLIPPGEFTMGSTQAEIDLIKLQDPDKGVRDIQRQMLSASVPPHRVTITRPFYMQTHEVSNGIYQRLLGTLPEKNDPQKPESAVRANVTLTDATRFCDALSRLEGKSPAFRTEGDMTQRILDADGYRLPTEAEWEYVCRAGTTTLWNFGDDRLIASAPEVIREHQTSHRGAAAVPNPFGIHDLYGGSSEWCFDRFIPYRSEALVDPFTQPRKNEAVSRGGSEFAGGGADPIYNNSVTRDRRTSPTSPYHGFGRVVLPISLKPTSDIDYALERDCADWLRSHHNAVEIRIGDRLRGIEHDQPLPTENFTLEKSGRGFAGPETGAEIQPRIDKFARLHRFQGGYLPFVASRQWAAAYAKMPSITHINAFKTDIQDEDLALFAAMPNLEYLSVDGCQKLTGKGVRNLAASRSLKRINLWDTSKINNSYTLEDVQALQDALPLCTITRGAGKPIPGLVPAKGLGSGKLFMHDPAFPQWIKDVQAMPVRMQLEAVSQKLVELNPEFDGKLTGHRGKEPPNITEGVVTGLGFATDNMTDISPIRALSGITHLKMNGSDTRKSKFQDLSPLEGLQLTTVAFSNSGVANLEPLRGMPLTEVEFIHTKVSSLAPLREMPLKIVRFGGIGMSVSDLSPLRDAPLTHLLCTSPVLSDLSPLAGKQLLSLDIQGTKVSDIGIVADMPLRFFFFAYDPGNDAHREFLKILRSIKTLEIINFKPVAEFWKIVDGK